MTDEVYDTTEGEFVDFATLEEWATIDKSKAARIEELEDNLAKAVKVLKCAKAYVEATSNGTFIAPDEPKIIKNIMKEMAEEDLASICTTLEQLTGGKDE